MSNPQSTNPSSPGSSEPIDSPPISKESHVMEIEEESQDKNQEKLRKKADDFLRICIELLDDLKSKGQEKHMEKIMASMNFLQQTLTTEILPSLMELMEKQGLPDIHEEAFSRLAQMCCVDQEKTINEARIVADRKGFQDHILANGAFQLLMDILNEAQEQNIEKVLEQGTLVLATICSGQKTNVLEVKNAAVVLMKIANQSECPRVLYNTLLALICLPGLYPDTEFPLQSETYIPFIQNLHQDNLIRGVNMNSSSDTELVLWILKVLENIPRDPGNSELFETPDMLEKLFLLLQHEDKRIRRLALEVFYEKPLPDILFNFIISQPRYVKKLIQIGSEDTFDIRRKVIVTLFFMVFNASVDELVLLAKMGVLTFLHQLIKREEDEELCVMGGIEGPERRLNIESFSLLEKRKARIYRPLNDNMSFDQIY